MTLLGKGETFLRFTLKGVFFPRGLNSIANPQKILASKIARTRKKLRGRLKTLGFKLKQESPNKLVILKNPSLKIILMTS